MTLKQSNSSEVMWKDFDQGLQEIFSSQQLTSQRYLQLHDFVFNYGAIPMDTKKPFFSGRKIYERVQQFLENHVLLLYIDIDGSKNGDIVQCYFNRLQEYQRSCDILNSICDYLNRHWIRTVSRDVPRNIFEIHQLAIIIWNNQMSSSIDKRVGVELLKLIEKERCGAVVDKKMIKFILNFYVSLGVTFDQHERLKPNECRLVAENLSFYKNLFEYNFLEDTGKFYIKENDSSSLAQMSVSGYLTKIETRLNQEKKRVNDYLHKSTLNRLLEICLTIFIENRLFDLLSKVKLLSTCEQQSAVSRISKLVSGFPDINVKFQLLLEINGNQE